MKNVIALIVMATVVLLVCGTGFALAKVSPYLQESSQVENGSFQNQIYEASKGVCTGIILAQNIKGEIFSVNFTRVVDYAIINIIDKGGEYEEIMEPLKVDKEELYFFGSPKKSNDILVIIVKQ